MLLNLSALGLVVAAAHAFDPTPADQMRPMATDRPDLTESALTVDAGHVQVEMDAVVATVEPAGPLPLALDFAVANLKLGLTPSMDLQLVVPSFGFGVDGKGVASPAAGDPALRFKWNLVGNDGGDIAAALMPWVSMASADLAWSGGLMVPVSFALPAELTLSTMAVIDALQSGDAIDLRGTVTASVSRPLWEGLGAYLEVLATGTAFASTGELMLSSGVTWLVQPDLQLDAGLRGPALGASPRLEAFLGFSIRR